MSIFRNTVWFVKGMKEYTKNGYLSASKNFNEKDVDVDASGKSYMITGANSGIGKSAAMMIAQKGGTVHLVCRSQERGEEAVKDIISKTGNQNVQLHLLDLSRPKEIHAFAERFKNTGQPLHVLVNNAGCMVNDRQLTEDGIEKNFATNTLGTYMLSVALVPLLLQCDNPRVITVSSGGMLTQLLNVKDLQFEKMKPFDGTMAYAQNKRQQIIINEQLAKRFPKIHFSCMHPGWADTPAVQTSMPGFYEKMKTRLRTADEGADTVVWLALSDAALKHPSGLFFQDRVAVPTYLPLTWSRTSEQDQGHLMTVLDEMNQQYTF